MLARTCVCCLLLACAGCRKETTSIPPSEDAATASAIPASNAPPSEAIAAKPSDDAEVAALLQQLTQAVRKFGVEKQRVPKNLEELVANRYLPGLPPAPAGKRFAINKNLEVYLADR